MNKDEFVEALRQSVEEAQDVVDDVCDIKIDALVKSQLLVFLVMKLVEIHEREALPPPLVLQATRPIPFHCPYMRNLKLAEGPGGSSWSAECEGAKRSCDLELGLRNYQECLHFRAQRASQALGMETLGREK